MLLHETEGEARGQESTHWETSSIIKLQVLSCTIQHEYLVEENLGEFGESLVVHQILPSKF